MASKPAPSKAIDTRPLVAKPVQTPVQQNPTVRQDATTRGLSDQSAPQKSLLQLTEPHKARVAVPAPLVSRPAPLSTRQQQMPPRVAALPTRRVPNFQAATPPQANAQPQGNGKLFEVIEETEKLQVQVRRSKILQTKANVFRTAVVDPQICDVVHFTERELSIIGKAEGATHVTLWFEGGDRRPITFLVNVVPDPVEVKIAETKYRLLQDVLSDLFPDSKVRLLLVANKLIVKGQAKDSEEATQIMQIVRSRSKQRGRFAEYSQPDGRTRCRRAK